jgi:hypothetical protein
MSSVLSFVIIVNLIEFYPFVKWSVSSLCFWRIYSVAQGGRGLQDTLKVHSKKFVGILNGIDTDTWNPSTDRFLKVQYSANDLYGKSANKAALRKQLKLASTQASQPLVCFLSSQPCTCLNIFLSPRFIRELKFPQAGWLHYEASSSKGCTSHQACNI